MIARERVRAKNCDTIAPSFYVCCFDRTLYGFASPLFMTLRLNGDIEHIQRENFDFEKLFNVLRWNGRNCSFGNDRGNSDSTSSSCIA